jgi:periplasmic protein TonB
MSAVMYSEGNRAFNYAVLASIVLHGLLLFGVSLRERAHRAEPQVAIIARLAELPAAAPAAAPPQAEPVKPRAEPVKPRAQPKPLPRRPVAKEEPLARSEPAPEPAPAESPAREAASPAQVEAPAAPPPVIAGVDQTRGQPATAPPAEPAEDPGSLEKYRQQLILAAPRYKRYPRIASDNNWSGFVALRMVVAPSGQVTSLTVTKTSGYDVLDQQAVEMFKSAAALVPVPPVLRGKQFAVEVGATYYFTD